VSAINELKNNDICIITKNALERYRNLSATLCCFYDERAWSGTIASQERGMATVFIRAALLVWLLMQQLYWLEQLRQERGRRAAVANVDLEGCPMQCDVMKL